MKANTTLATTTTSDGTKLSLREHDGHYSLYIGSRQLMSSRAPGSEMRMAELACERLAKAGNARVLIGGLGLGFTLRRVLELVGPEVVVDLVEVSADVVAWNREHLRALNGALLDDPRVQLHIDDVYAVLTRAKAGSYDAALLDIDNGPAALVERGNARIYAGRGLHALSLALRPGGRAVFWSASPDRSFENRLTSAGFRAKAVGAKAHAQAKHDTHTLFVADWRT